MALKIRLSRGGSKKRPFYRIVVSENTSPRDGKFIERLGSFNPLLADGVADKLIVNAERVKYWVSVGAQPTEKVSKLLKGMNLVADLKQSERPKKSAPKKKAQERMKALEEAKAAAAAE